MTEQTDAAEVEALAERLVRWEMGLDGANETDHWADRLARAILASDWLAAREAAARADERERVAAAIERHQFATGLNWKARGWSRERDLVWLRPRAQRPRRDGPLPGVAALPQRADGAAVWLPRAVDPPHHPRRQP